MKMCKFTMLSIVTFAGVILAGCNGGGNAGPAATTQYGQMTVESAQQLGVYSNLKTALYPVMLSYGYYGTESNYQKANVANTKSIYNYDTLGNLASSSYFKAESVSAYAIQYTTPGVNATTEPLDVVHNVSGLVIIPNGITPRGVVMYFHPTTFGKNQVPSCLGRLTGGATVSQNIPAYCNVTSLDNTGAEVFSQLAAIYAARGFIVLAPDYVGQGADYSSVHPYVAYPENNVLTAFNMMAPMRQILAQAPFNISASTALPLFVTGYSEGGGYALKASQLAQTSQAQLLANNNLQLKITSPQEGAYSLPDQMNFAFEDNYDGLFSCSSVESNCGNNDMMKTDQSGPTDVVDAMNNWDIVSAPSAAGSKPALTSYVLTAVANYTFHNISGAYDTEMNHQFWAQINMPGGVVANLYQLYSGVYGTKYTGGTISAAIVGNATTINSYDTYESKNVTFFILGNPFPYTMKAYYYGSNNSALNFINEGVTTDPNFIQILKTGSTYNWKTSSPINLIHLAYDSLVPVINANQAYSCMKHGISYPGSATSESSVAECNPAVASSGLIESTIIQNFQIVNNATQLTPMISASAVNPYAISKFWVKPELNGVTLPFGGLPFDHGNISALGNIVALCTFENALDYGSNSGTCPNL